MGTPQIGLWLPVVGRQLLMLVQQAARQSLAQYSLALAFRLPSLSR